MQKGFNPFENRRLETTAGSDPGHGNIFPPRNSPRDSLEPGERNRDAFHNVPTYIPQVYEQSSTSARLRGFSYLLRFAATNAFSSACFSRIIVPSQREHRRAQGGTSVETQGNKAKAPGIYAVVHPHEMRASSLDVTGQEVR